VREILGDIIYGVDAISLENEAIRLLTEHGMTLAAAESCSGGLLSKRLTDIPGASEAFMGGMVTYSADSKTLLLGVDDALIREKGVVSREVALAMADGARLKLGADIGIGITGVAGPDGDGSGIELGSAFVALTTADKSFCRSLRLFHDRARIRMSSASHALDMIRRFLTGLQVAD
jgi:nicotinamide-nucleotide amidase